MTTAVSGETAPRRSESWGTDASEPRVPTSISDAIVAWREAAVCDRQGGRFVRAA